jgi:hypothetical protein
MVIDRSAGGCYSVCHSLVRARIFSSVRPGGDILGVRGRPAQAAPVPNGSLLGGCTPSALLSPLLSRLLRPEAGPAP